MTREKYVAILCVFPATRFQKCRKWKKGWKTPGKKTNNGWYYQMKERHQLLSNVSQESKYLWYNVSFSFYDTLAE